MNKILIVTILAIIILSVWVLVTKNKEDDNKTNELIRF